MAELTIGGKTVTVRFEMLDWYLAGKALNIEFLPWGDSPFWRNAAEAPPSGAIEADLAIMFVAVRKDFPGLTLEQLAGMIPDTEAWFEAQRVTQEALLDFFQRAATAAARVTAAESATAAGGATQTPGPNSTQ